MPVLHPKDAAVLDLKRARDRLLKLQQRVCPAHGVARYAVSRGAEGPDAAAPAE